VSTRASSNVRWFLIFWLFVLSAVAYLDRVNISIAGGLIAEEFHITNVQLGLVFSSFLFGYALLQTPAGWLADRFGARRMLFVGVLWWGLFSALTAGISSRIASALTLLIVIRFLLGAGEAIIYPTSNQFVSRWIPSNERGIANGIIFAGVGIGAGITPPLISFLMAHYGWRSSFVLCALIGLAAGAVWYFTARDTPQSHHWVSPSELESIERGLPELQREGNSGSSLLSWLAILSSRTIWTITLAYFCFGYVAWVFFSWFYLYLAKVRGLNLKSSALYATLPFLAMAVCSPLGGAIGDWITKRTNSRLGRCGISVLGFLLTAVFITAGSAAQDVRLASVVLAGGAGSLYLTQSSFWAVSADLGGKSSGSVSGLMNMGNQLGGMLTVSLTPLLADKFGWNASFHTAAAVAVLGAIFWLGVDPRTSLQIRPAVEISPQRISK
jgi:ACS family glucarate transporter-like MFS transporter